MIDPTKFEYEENYPENRFLIPCFVFIRLIVR